MDTIEKKTILIVDDVAINRVLLRTIFENDYNIIEAENGWLALAAIEAHPEVFVVILDLVMPVMDGYDVLKKMGKSKKMKDIPVIVVTGSDDDKSQILALDLGAIDVISKPYSPQVVKARISNAIDRRIAQLKAQESQLLEFKLEQQQLELQKSRVDALTGLCSKHFFLSEVERIITSNPNKQYVLGVLDIDRFKVFNDVFGFLNGDKLLADIGEAVTKVNGILLASRIDADRFSALFEKEELDCEANARQLQEWFDNYYVSFDFSVKYGYYEIEESDMDAGLIYDRAYLALKSVKGTAGMKIGHYNSSLRQNLIDEQELQSEINLAFENNQFRVWFQPQYDYSTGKMTGAEALVRWIHPVRGIIPAYKFISLMEKNGSITRLDEYVWEHCCIHLREWLDSPPKTSQTSPLPISTNISRADLLRPDLPEVIVALTDKYRIPRNLLNLEITESSYMDDSEQLLATVNRLRELGFTLEMDDFGAGYSSLNTLKDVPVDILKLDMKFIAGAQESARGGSILSSVIRMARWLKLPVIAEGVETREQADFLRSIGCRYMQGFHFARPMSSEDFSQLYWSDDSSAISIQQHDMDFKSVEPFLNATSQTALLFNSFLGGAAICEFTRGNIELLRANRMFYNILHTTQESFEPWMTEFQNYFDDDSRNRLLVALDTLADRTLELKLECKSLPEAGSTYVWTLLRVKLLAQSDGCSIVYIGVDDITDSIATVSEAHNQDDLLISLCQGNQESRINNSITKDTLNISEQLFSILAKSTDPGQSIEQALMVIGKFLNVSRAYVIENSSDGKAFSTTFEWCNGNVKPRKTGESIEYPENYSSKAYTKMFNKSGSFTCNNVSTLNKELHFAVAKQGVQSFAQWGVWLKNKFVGYVGFDDCQNAREWPKAALSLLSLTSSYIGVLLGKLRD